MYSAILSGDSWDEPRPADGCAANKVMLVSRTDQSIHPLPLASMYGILSQYSVILAFESYPALPFARCAQSLSAAN